MLADSQDKQTSVPITLTLIQARLPEDPMAAHERACIERRLSSHPSTLHTYNVFRDEITPSCLDGTDGIIIGGSGDFSVHHPESQQWVQPLCDLVKRALDQGLPGFGICFGHQILGLALDVPVVTDSARTEIGTIDLNLTEAGSNDPVFSALPTRFAAHTGHSDYVVLPPKSTEVLATGGAIPTQALKVRGRPFYSTQFHSDLTAAEARERYRVYQQSLEKVSSVATKNGELKFALQRDDATVLLAGFARLIEQHRA